MCKLQEYFGSNSHISCGIITRSKDELSAVEQELDTQGDMVRDGVVWRRRRGDTEKVRKLAKKLSNDVDQLKKEKEEYSA